MSDRHLANSLSMLTGMATRQHDVIVRDKPIQEWIDTLNKETKRRQRMSNKHI
jgi:hypothetical protein